MFWQCKYLAPIGLLSSRSFSTNGKLMARTYADAISSLNTLQSNFAKVEAIRKHGRLDNELVIPEMIKWCQRIGYETSDFDRLNAIHIAGTKGKGSTAAFVSSILTKFLDQPRDGNNGKPLSKIGLYTSPHLRFVRERIQINGRPLSEEQFTKYFFEVWDRLESAATVEGKDPQAPGTKPFYFHYLTLMAFHCYLSEAVDSAIIECGIGGEYDSTNVLRKPAVTGITNLGVDHVALLGGTLPEIAWHKAGVMKPGSTCYTPTSQPTETKPVLERRAVEANSQLTFVDVDPRIADGTLKLGLQADFQKTNASLAMAISKDWLTRHGYAGDPSIDERIAQGLLDVRWGGRCETRFEPGIVWCIDGGHTQDSIKLAGKWFAEVIQSQAKPQSSSTKPPRYLIFNQQTRDASALATALHDTLAAALKDEKPFTHAIFCTNTTFKETGFKPDLVSINANASEVEALTVQRQLATTWAGIDSATQVEVVRTIEEAAQLVRDAASLSAAGDTPVTALVTGSLHLVGGFLEVLESGS